MGEILGQLDAELGRHVEVGMNDANLKRILKIVNNAREYFKPIYDRYNEYRFFLYETTLSDDERGVLTFLNKPELEFNVLLPHVMRQLGEQLSQEPGVVISPNPESEKPVDPQLLTFVEDHLRHIFYEAKKTSVMAQIAQESFTGGFSVMKCWTRYSSPESFNLVGELGKAFDPTLVGFDPLARDPDKGDGDFSFELYPIRFDEYKRKYPNSKYDQMTFNHDNTIQGYSWNYVHNSDKYVVVCEYYEKRKTKMQICKISTGEIMPLKEYNDRLEKFKALNTIQQPPIIVEQRETEMTVIDRYVFTSTEILDYRETIYPRLPHIWVGGNDIVLRRTDGGNSQLMTYPLTWHAQDAQRLKNYTGQTLAAFIENMVMAKWMFAKESIPAEPDYQNAIIKPQAAATIVYNAFDVDNPTKALPPPQQINAAEPPAILINTFMQADMLIQNILGSYDASSGVNRGDVSGTAFAQAVRQSSPVNLAYVNSLMQAIAGAARWLIDIWPKIYVSKRALPAIGADSKKYLRKVNGEDGLILDYKIGDLNVQIEAGPSFAVQRQEALEIMARLGQAFPKIAQFINDVGIETVLDNVEMRGIDGLKKQVSEWQKKLPQMQQQQMQMQQQMDPRLQKVQVEKMKVENAQQELALKAAEAKAHETLEAGKLGVDQMRADTERVRAMAEIGEMQTEALLKREKHDTEKYHSATELAIKAAGQDQEHARELTKLQHTILNTVTPENKAE